MAQIHETARRLLAVGRSKGAHTFTEIARALGASDQSATNWKARGVPAAIIIQAASIYGVDPRWLSVHPDGKPPEFVPRPESPYPRSSQATLPSKVAETRMTYGLDPDEQCLIDAYRIADQGLKRSMLVLARDALYQFAKRKTTKD